MILQAGGVRCNAEIPDDLLDSHVAATPDACKLLGQALERLTLSARAAHLRRRVRAFRLSQHSAGSCSNPAQRA